MAERQQKAAADNNPRSKDVLSLKETLSQRQSKELVVALAGPLGCGIKQVKRLLTDELKSAGYEVVDIRLSDLMRLAVNEHKKLLSLKEYLPSEGTDNFDRISKLQCLGNELRNYSSNDVVAQLAVQEIALWRKNHPEQTEADKIAVMHNTAFIIDQLKHPDEAKLLKLIYGKIFYQLGILSTEEEKLSRLKNNGISRSNAVKLIEDDRNQEYKHGQKLEKTLSFSDYFISNTSNNLPSIKSNINRFLCLAHGVNGITPTKDEVGMYTAYSTSLRSACLSRQVGAAICDDDGNVLAVGRNDVPKFTGGLYTVEDGANDHRCINHGAKCYNTEKINQLKEKIRVILVKDGGVAENISHKLMENIAENTPLGSLIEFSRAIHAEMDAITTLARSMQSSSKGTIIYTTTFPCHNCARHIVAAGIKRVVYIEPYAKSLAIDLHSDSICVEEQSNEKLAISSFEGVAPTRYQSFFLAKGKRKDDTDGKAITNTLVESEHVDSVLVAKYTDTEKKVTELLSESLKVSDNRIDLVPQDDP